MSESKKDTFPRATVEAELPSGTKVKLREPTGKDELDATADSGSDTLEGTSAVIREWSLLMRCTLEIDGKPLDQTSVTPEAFRDRFAAKDFVMMRRLWLDTFYATSKEEERRFEKSKRVGTC